MLMMIKRSNRGKLSGSLGGRALPDMRRGVQRKRHGLFYALVLALGFILALGTAPSTAEAAISGAPAHEKSAKINADGTVDVTLNVTGAVDQSSESSKADVIVVLDLSGSMNLGVNKVSDRNADKSKTYYVVDDNYNVRTVKYRTSFFGGYWYYTDSNTRCWESTFYESTRLEVAKTAVNNLVTNLLANNSSHPDSVRVSLVTFSNTATVKMGLTVNEGSITSTVSGLKANGGTNWEDALATASSIKTRDGASASVVFVSDGDPTYRSTLGEKEDGFRQRYDDDTGKYYYGQGDDDTSGQSYDYAKKQAQAIVNKGWELYSVAAFGNVDNMQKLVTDAGEQATGHYFEASDSSSLNTAFNSIVKSITTTVSYTNVSIHDVLSQSVSYVLPDGAKEPTFTYQKNGESWTPTTLAKVEDGAVVWNVGDLDQNVTYSVTFKVQLTQEAYDAAAPKDDVEAVTSVKTNSDDEAKDYVQYQIKTDVNGTPTTSDPKKAKYESPTVSVPTSTLHVSKTWVKNGWDSVSVPSELTLQIQQDGKNYKTVTLNAGNQWKADVTVAAGPTGHTYSVEEKNAPAGWDATLPEGVKMQGLTSQNGTQEIVNTIKTNTLTIKKSVTGNFGDTSKDFNFVLTSSASAKVQNGTSTGVNLENGSFTLKNGQSLVVELPYGATYQVVENDPKGTNDTVGYTTSIDVGGSGATTDVSARKASSPDGGITKDTTITYANKRDVTPDVGVDLGSGAPYVAVVGGIGIAGVIWMALKRRNSQGI